MVPLPNAAFNARINTALQGLCSTNNPGDKRCAALNAISDSQQQQRWTKSANENAGQHKIHTAATTMHHDQA